MNTNDYVELSEVFDEIHFRYQVNWKLILRTNYKNGSICVLFTSTKNDDVELDYPISTFGYYKTHDEIYNRIREDLEDCGLKEVGLTNTYKDIYDD